MATAVTSFAYRSTWPSHHGRGQASDLKLWDGRSGCDFSRLRIAGPPSMLYGDGGDEFRVQVHLAITSRARSVLAADGGQHADDRGRGLVDVIGDGDPLGPGPPEPPHAVLAAGDDHAFLKRPRQGRHVVVLVVL